MCWQVYYYVVDSPRNEGKDFFEINMQTGEVFTKIVFDREKQGAYALEVEARDGAPSARPNSGDQPNSGKWISDFSKKLWSDVIKAPVWSGFVWNVLCCLWIIMYGFIIPWH